MLTPEQKAEIIRLRQENPKEWTWRNLAETFGVSRTAIEHTLEPTRVKGRTYKWRNAHREQFNKYQREARARKEQHGN